MSTACDSFKPHRWKPKQCSACFRPKAEHSGVGEDTNNEPNSDQPKATTKMKQSPYYKRFSFSDENGLNQNSASVPTKTNQTLCNTVANGSCGASRNTTKLQKPVSEDKPEKINAEQSISLQAAVVENRPSESVSDKQGLVNDHVEDKSKATSEVTSDINSDMSASTPPRPPAPRVRSHTMVVVPRVKPRKHIPEPSSLPVSTIKTLPRDLQIQPVPAPRRVRINRSTSPKPAPLDDSTTVCRAKSLDNLDVSPPSERKVKFNLEATTIPNDAPSVDKKDGTIHPYAVSEVPDVLQKVSSEENKVVQQSQDNTVPVEGDDDHEYIEADQVHAAVVAVGELKSKHRPQITKYATLSTLQPVLQPDKKPAGNGGIKQKAMSGGAITTTKAVPRRHAPPPPGVSRKRSATITSGDKLHMHNYAAPRRPPPPASIYYTNANITRPSKVNEAPVNKVPPQKPARTPETFDYENLNGVTSTEEPAEYSVIDDAVTSRQNAPRPKKPVRMPKEASPMSDGGQMSSNQQPVIKGKYIDLDIDQLESTRASTPLMKYENFDDFSPRPSSPDVKSLDSLNALSVPFEGAAQVHDAIVNSLNVASVELTKLYFNEYSYMGKMVCSKWSEFEPVSAAVPGTAACVKHSGKLLSLQVNYWMI